MFVAASTHCFAELPIKDSLGKLADLEYTASEVVIGKKKDTIFCDIEEQMSPEGAALLFRQARRVPPVSIYCDMDPDDPEFKERFDFCCSVAKAAKVIQITIKASELGTPFNAEVERLRDLTHTAVRDGLIIGLATEGGRMSEDPDCVKSLCKSVRDLTVTLDTSHFIYNCVKQKEYDHILEYVTHIRLRDTTKEKLQLQVGQGIQDYSKLVIQLEKINYRGALCADLAYLPDLDQDAEMRKMRLLLESLL